ncbi:N-acetylglucosaminyl-phosphatidylinositol de-N-acetylase-like [Dysidea avara]|uniref:N-acetylglucosaminyl-phosphatidylinositol de-N-acetylase-like n=1 Tax=Dysidea avara TaxID=196820 RepID=UPI00331E90FA
MAFTPSLFSLFNWERPQMDVIVVVLLVLIVLLLSSVIIAFVFTTTSQFLLDNRKVLFVTAHPDDECMFFAPVILRASQNSSTTFLLCLSNGNYYSQGDVREKEFYKSCAVLGVKKEHARLINDPLLLDGPHTQWNSKEIEKHLLQAVNDFHIQTIISFDNWGVSGHPNHIAISKCLRQLVECGRLPTSIKLVLSLETVGILRKYSSIMDISISCFTNWQFCVISNVKSFIRAQAAMNAHSSQLFWFRIIYVMFSRYMIINTFKPLYYQM